MANSIVTIKKRTTNYGETVKDVYVDGYILARAVGDKVIEITKEYYKNKKCYIFKI